MMPLSYKKIQLLLILMTLALSSFGQIPPKTLSAGWSLDFSNRQTPTNGSFTSHLTSQKEFHYFYKENRALVIGLYLGHFDNKSFGRSGGLPSDITYMTNANHIGGYIGKRNHYTIHENLHFFIGFGGIFLRQNRQTKYYFDEGYEEYDGVSNLKSFSLMGYGNLGILYLINPKFSIETKLLEGQLEHSRPLKDVLGTEFSSQTWRFDLNGMMDRVSVAVRYYF
jgi:hypothetical protein